MCKKLMCSVAAATVIELAVMTTIGYPQIGVARRMHAPQIEKKDVALDTTSRGDRPVARTDDRARKELKSSGFKVGLQSVRFGEAKAGAGCSKWVCGSNSPVVDGAAIATQPARRHRAEQLTDKDVVLGRRGDRSVARTDDRERDALKSPGFKVGLRGARFGEVKAGAGCPRIMCNSPIVDGAAIVAQPNQARSARRHVAHQLAEKDVMLGDASAQAVVQRKLDPRRRDESVRKELQNPGSKVALQDARFGEVKAGGACLPWVCNSPIVDGAAIVAQPARRHQAQQLTERDVVISDTTRRGERPVARTNDRMRKVLKIPGFKGGLRGARFGEVKVGGSCLPWSCNSPIVDGAAIVAEPNQARPARRHVARQLTEKDVVLGDASAQVVVQRKLDPRRRDESVRKELQNPGSKVALQGARFGEVKAGGACLPWVCNSPIVDGATIVAEPNQARPARRHVARQLTEKDVVLGDASAQVVVQRKLDPRRRDESVRKELQNPGSKVVVQGARFGEVRVGAVCPPWMCNSPIVDGAAIVGQPARRHQAQQLNEKDVVLGETRRGDRPVARTDDHLRKVLHRPGFNGALQRARFGEVLAGLGGCVPWGCGANSPIVDSAAIHSRMQNLSGLKLD